MRKEERYILNIGLFYIINVLGDGIVIKFIISNGLFFRIKINILEVALSLTTIFSIIKNDLAEHFSFNGIKWRCIA